MKFVQFNTFDEQRRKVVIRAEKVLGLAPDEDSDSQFGYVVVCSGEEYFRVKTTPGEALELLSGAE